MLAAKRIQLRGVRTTFHAKIDLRIAFILIIFVIDIFFYRGRTPDSARVDIFSFVGFSTFRSFRDPLRESVRQYRKWSMTTSRWIDFLKFG